VKNILHTGNGVHHEIHFKVMGSLLQHARTLGICLREA
jgi:hypothetical protein